MITTNLESLNISDDASKNPKLTKNDIENYGIVYTPFFFS